MARANDNSKADPRQVEKSQALWNKFAWTVKWIVIAHIVGLALLAMILL